MNWENPKTILQYQKVIQIYIERDYHIQQTCFGIPPSSVHKWYEKMKLSIYYYKKQKKRVLVSIFTLYISLSRMVTWKKYRSFICKKMTFWRPFCIFLPRISTGSWWLWKLSYNPKACLWKILLTYQITRKSV